MKFVFFDLDGTLTDPGIGITNSVMYALNKFGIEVKDRTELFRFIGPPLIPSFMNYYGFSKEDAVKAVVFYREYYAECGIFENKLYPGVPELLAKLKDDGVKIVMATSKPEIFAEKIAEHYDIAKYFDLIAGATENETRTEKDEVIAYALEKLENPPSGKITMVGDRFYDVKGAAKFGIPTIGVLYGYGDEKELTDAGAYAVAKTPEEVYIKLQK